MKNRTRLIALLLILIASNTSFAQTITKQEKGYFNLTEIGYFIVKVEQEVDFDDVSLKGDAPAYAASLRNINGLFLTNQLSVGVGVGLENYTLNNSNSYTNTFQLFGDVRYYARNSGTSMFAYGDFGGSLAISSEMSKGPMFNLGAGYKFKLGNKTALCGSAGFISQSITDYPIFSKNKYTGLSLKVGLLL